MKKIIALAIIILILLTTWIVINNEAQGENFRKVAKGMSEQEILSIYGKPTIRRTGCRDTPTWEGSPIVETKCSFEMQYNALILPKFWTVGFDANGNVISKYEYISP